MKKIILVIISCFVLILCKGQSNHYELSGDIQGYNDSTWIYLSNLEKKSQSFRLTDDKKLPFQSVDKGYNDSTLLIKGKFKFEGIYNGPKLFAIHTKNGGDPSKCDVTTIWIDNSNIQLRAKKGDFKNAIIIGSELQKQSDKYKIKLGSIDNSMDSIDNAMKRIAKSDSIGLRSLMNKQDELLYKITDVDRHFINENPDELFSAYLLTLTLNRIPKDETKALYENLSDKVKKSRFGIETKSFIDEQFVDK